VTELKLRYIREGIAVKMRHVRVLVTGVATILFIGIPSALSQMSLACTSFMAMTDHLVILGDSEDAGADHPLARNPAGGIVFFLPASAGNYGRMHLGWLWQGKYRSFQAGMNDQGLAYALTAVPDVSMNRHPERPFLHGRDSFYDRILRNAATVEEAIDLTLQFNFPSCWFQIQYADATGNSAIISPGIGGEMVITTRTPESDYLVAATFNVADPNQFIGRDSFRRHTTAEEMLATITDDAILTISSFSEVLAAVARQRAYFLGGSYTVYSTAYDLTNREAHIYLLSHFGEPIQIDVIEALQEGERAIFLKDMIPSKSLRSATRRYWATQTVGGLALFLPLGAILYGLALLVRLVSRLKKRRDTKPDSA